MKSLIRIGLLAGAALIASAFPAAAAEYRSEYRLSTVLPDSFPWGAGGMRWAELIKERTQGRITVKMYPGASLVGGDQTKEFTALRQGTIDLAVGSTINWSPQVRELNLFALPFLMPDYKAIDALTKGEVGARSVCHTGHQGCRSAGLGRERIPRDFQFQARYPRSR